MQTDRDMLIQLITKWHENPEPFKYLADYLLANGVIVPPCKVGDIVWFLVKGFDFPFEAKVNKIVIQQAGVVMSCGLKGYYSASFTINDLVKTVFLTKEQAEEKLKELGK